MNHRKRIAKPAGKNFKMELYALAKNNKELQLLIISAYRAHKHNQHIHKIWREMEKFPDFKDSYIKNVMGEHLTGVDDISETLCKLYPEIFKKYKKLLSRDRMIGCALEVALVLQK